MIITFFGHSDFIAAKITEEKLDSILSGIPNDEKVDFYLGGYGRFDSFAYTCAKKYQINHQNAKLIFVTPYISEKYIKKRADGYDEIIYPELENTMEKFSIPHRNKWMIKKADIVITYVEHSSGGAYTAYKYAKKIGKNIINLVE